MTCLAILKLKTHIGTILNYARKNLLQKCDDHTTDLHKDLFLFHCESQSNFATFNMQSIPEMVAV